MHTPNSASRNDPVDTGGYALDVGARIGQWWTIVDMIGIFLRRMDVERDGMEQEWIRGKAIRGIFELFGQASSMGLAGLGFQGKP